MASRATPIGMIFGIYVWSILIATRTTSFAVLARWCDQHPGTVRTAKPGAILHRLRVPRAALNRGGRGVSSAVDLRGTYFVANLSRSASVNFSDCAAGTSVGFQLGWT